MTPAQGRRSPKPAQVVVHQRTGDVSGSGEDLPPLFASGIPWIDRAYNVIRQLRRDHGLPDIRPLAEPSHQSEV